MNAIAPTSGCATGGMPFQEARDRVLRLAAGPLPAEAVPLSACAGRIAAEPVCARLDLPRFDQSAMDGYAVAAATLTPGACLPVTGRTAAGQLPGHLAAGAHRILTGAPLPAGADTVIAQEDVLREHDTICLRAVPGPGANLRRRGEDMRAGAPLIQPGTCLDWRHVAVLAAQGIGTVAVRRAPVVALLSSGRELRPFGRPLDPGQIHDSNQPMLAALLRAWGARVLEPPPIADDPASLRGALRSAAERADLVITTAGISVGDEDHVRDALRDLGGGLSVLKVAMKPGKPLAAGRLGSAIFVGLPGNPQAALAGAVGFVRSLLARLSGAPEPASIAAHAAFDLPRRSGRTELILIRLTQRGACLWAERTGPDGSGRMAPLLAADGFALLPPEAESVHEGAMLTILPFAPSA